MVQFHQRRLVVTQESRELADALPQVEPQIGKRLARTIRQSAASASMRISRRRQHDWPPPRSSNLLAALFDPALHTTGAGVRHQDDCALTTSPVAPPQRIHGE